MVCPLVGIWAYHSKDSFRLKDVDGSRLNNVADFRRDVGLALPPPQNNFKATVWTEIRNANVQFTNEPDEICLKPT